MRRCREHIQKYSTFDNSKLLIKSIPESNNRRKPPALQPRIKDSSLEPSIRVNNDLGIPILPLIKLLISSLRIRKTNLMRNHKAGLGLAGDNHVPQVPVVGFNVALAGAEGKTLFQLAC